MAGVGGSGGPALIRQDRVGVGGSKLVGMSTAWDDMTPVERRDARLEGAARHYPGWATVISDLRTELIAIDPEFELRDIKEKWGRLRVSITVGDPVIRERAWELALAAERRSGTVCELCGNPGTRHESSGGWLKTYCSGCVDEIRSQGRVFVPSPPIRS